MYTIRWATLVTSQPYAMCENSPSKSTASWNPTTRRVIQQGTRRDTHDAADAGGVGMTAIPTTRTDLPSVQPTQVPPSASTAHQSSAPSSSPKLRPAATWPKHSQTPSDGDIPGGNGSTSPVSTGSWTLERGKRELEARKVRLEELRALRRSSTG